MKRKLLNKFNNKLMPKQRAMKTFLFSCFSSHYLGVKSDKWNKTKEEKIARRDFWHKIL